MWTTLNRMKSVVAIFIGALLRQVLLGKNSTNLQVTGGINRNKSFALCHDQEQWSNLQEEVFLVITKGIFVVAPCITVNLMECLLMEHANVIGMTLR